MSFGRIIYAAPADLRSTAAHNVHIVRMCEALAEHGEQVTLVVKDAPPWDRIAADFGLGDRFEILASPSRTGRLASAHFASAVLRVSRTGDLVLTRHLPTALLTAAFGRATILELHAPPDARRSRIMFRLLLRSKSFIGLVVITRALERHFLQAFGRGLQGRTIVLTDGANPRVMADTGKRDLKSPAIGYVGTFLPGKGADLVLRIAEAMPEAHFYLVGGEAADAGLRDGQVPKNVHFAGRLPHREATDWIDSFDIALLPNSTRVLVSGGTVDIGQWTSPLKLFEYMAAGRPVVASRIPVLEEVLEDGRNCLLADPDRPSEWVEAIKCLVRNPDTAVRIGNQAREDFASNYTWARRAEKLISFARHGLTRRGRELGAGTRPAKTT